MILRLADHFTKTEYPNSYYANTGLDAPLFPELDGVVDCDVCIIGAGFTGLSAALFLVENNYRVVVVEAARIGWGASGRNGGQLINGFSGDLSSIGKKLGNGYELIARSMLKEGVQIVRELIRKYKIECDLRNGSLAVACTDSQMRRLKDLHKEWNDAGIVQTELLDKVSLAQHINSTRYCGGMIDHDGGHLHPLNLALGEAKAYTGLGGILYETSPVTEIEIDLSTPRVRTSRGEINCLKLLLCGNAYLEIPGHEFSNQILPVFSEIVATEPIEKSLAESLLPSNASVYDMQFINDYFRLSVDRRMLFGSSAQYGRQYNRPVGEIPNRHMRKVFPELANTKIDYAWRGMFAVTVSRLPQLGQIAQDTYFGRAYSGHGVNTSHLFGKVLSEAVSGNKERFDVFAQMPKAHFPGGPKLRGLITSLGAQWYMLRDYAGI